MSKTTCSNFVCHCCGIPMRGMSGDYCPECLKKKPELQLKQRKSMMPLSMIGRNILRLLHRK